MMKRLSRRISILVFIALTLSGCDGRDHTNPLDPLNPDTGGTPDNLNAIADNGKVSLEWRDLGFDNIIGYNLLRVDEDTGESTLVNDRPISPSETSRSDEGVINDHTYTYTLYFLTPANETLPSLPDRATPGPTTVWVADFNSLSIRKISPDGRDLVRSVSGLSGPWDLSVSPAGDMIWVADYSAGRVNKYDIEGDFLLDYKQSSAGKGQPLSLDYDAGSGTVWIGGRYPDGVDHITDQGVEIAYYSSIPYPADIDVDGSDGSVWVASRDSHAVFRLRSGDESFTSLSGFDRPNSVAIDPGTGNCWVADGSTVTVLDREGNSLLSLGGFTSPEVVAVDAGDGSCWVADNRGFWSVTRLSPSGEIGVEVGGFDFISDMAVNESDGTCWLTTVTAEEGEVIKLSRDGEVLGRVGRLAYPAAIAVLP